MKKSELCLAPNFQIGISIGQAEHFLFWNQTWQNNQIPKSKSWPAEHPLRLGA